MPGSKSPLSGGCGVWQGCYWIEHFLGTPRAQHIRLPSLISSASIYQVHLCAGYSAGNWEEGRKAWLLSWSSRSSVGNRYTQLTAAVTQRDALLKARTGCAK